MGRDATVSLVVFCKNSIVCGADAAQTSGDSDVWTNGAADSSGAIRGRMPEASEVVAKPTAAFAADANADGYVTLGDAGVWLQQVFFLPGDWLLWALATHAGPVARFLEVGAADYRGLLSGFISTCTWLLALIVISIAYQFIRDVDRKLTRGAVDFYDDTRRRWRIAAAVLRQRWRGADRKRDSHSIEFAEDIELSEQELAVLRLHSDLGAGYALTVSDVARAVRARKQQIASLLDRLKSLGLLNRTGGADGESAYTLSAAGRALLMFRRLKPVSVNGASPR